MTKLLILSSAERLRFDSPPKFTADERAMYFSLAQEELKLTQELRTATNKVGFVLGPKVRNLRPAATLVLKL